MNKKILVSTLFLLTNNTIHAMENSSVLKNRKKNKMSIYASLSCCNINNKEYEEQHEKNEMSIIARLSCCNIAINKTHKKGDQTTDKSKNQ